MTTANGVTSYAYDAAGRVTTVTAGAEQLQLAYDAAGRISSLTYPGGATVEYTYTPDGWLPATLTAKKAGVVSWSEAYVRDAADRITQVTEASGKVRGYTYDAAGRLLTETTQVGAQIQTITYGYDAVGNRTSRTDQDGTKTWTYDDDHRLISDGVHTYSHDAGGRLTQRTGGGVTVTYEYDAFDHLIGVTRASVAGTTTVTYEYDGLGGLMSRTVNGQTRRFVNDHGTGLSVPVEEIDEASGDVTRNLLRPGGQRPHVWGRVGPSQSSFPVVDAIGTVRHVLSGTGAGLGDLAYADAFGTDLGTSFPDLPFRFAGERHDDVAGLYHLRARVYDPATGRFLTRDPLALDEVRPETTNPFIYAVNNPVNVVDPTGRVPMLEYLVSLSIGEPIAQSAAAIIFGALLSTKPTGPPSTEWGTSNHGAQADNFLIYESDISGNFSAHYLHEDGVYFPPQIGVAITYQWNWGGSTGYTYNVLNEFFFEGGALWSQFAITGGVKYKVFGAATGIWLTYRMMFAPSVMFDGRKAAIRRTNGSGGGPVAALLFQRGTQWQIGSIGNNSVGFSSSMGFGVQALGGDVPDFPVDDPFGGPGGGFGGPSGDGGPSGGGVGGPTSGGGGGCSPPACCAANPVCCPPACCLADLQVDIVEVETASCPDLAIETVVSNTGTVGVTQTIVRYFAGDPDQGAPALHDSYVLEIPAGGSVTFVADVPIPPALLGQPITIHAVVDPDGFVPECSEDNNEGQADGPVSCSP